MRPTSFLPVLLAATALVVVQSTWAGQAPGSASDPDVPVSHHDRVYAAEQFSNTVSVTDPADNKLLGVVRLGDPTPGNLSPLYRGQLLVHGMGFSPDHHTLAVVSIGSNSVAFIDTATNAVKHITYVGRSPHEAFFTPDGSEVWVTVRGENYVAVLDGKTYEEKTRIIVPGGPGMQIFAPDGKYGCVCSSFNPETVVISVADHKIVGQVKQVGGGNSAGQAAVFLSQTAEYVHLLVRSRGLEKSMPQYLIRRIEGNPALTLRTYTELVALEGAGHLKRVQWRDNRTGAIETRDIRHVFIMTGASPSTRWLQECVALDAQGFIKTDPDLSQDDLEQAHWPLARAPHLLETSLPGVFAVGDVRGGSIKRVASAVGAGSIAITFVHQVLRE